jgi:two-component system, OmpR family, sensor histidine kinase KdpD
LLPRVIRLMASLTGVAALTFAAHRVLPVNATTAGFGYLLLVLIIASTWGFVDALAASIAATLVFNYFFFPPIGTFTIEDPKNWVALFSFLVCSLIASRLSEIAKRRAQDAVSRQQDLERLYTFSRGILLITNSEPFAKQLVTKLAEIFELSAAVLYDMRAGEFYRAGPAEFEGMDEQLREAALNGTSFFEAAGARQVTAVRLGSEPIASLGMQSYHMPDSVVQGIANLVAIGLERARAQDLAHQVEAARQSEQLRTTLIDAMAHEFKTPLTSIKAATTSLLATPAQAEESRTELLRIADEEADHLRDLIDNAVEMARLDGSRIDVVIEPSDVVEVVREVAASMKTGMDGRDMELISNGTLPRMSFDRRLVKLALKQIVDNALKYSPPETPIQIRISRSGGALNLDVTNRGEGIPLQEQSRIFDRFYRSPATKQQIPGSGLGLSIAHRIAEAHKGDLTVESRPGETTFRLTLPLVNDEEERD